jgi:hypothetical protein
MSNDNDLRDIFAILAMHALLLDQGNKEGLCSEAYKIADQMLIERDK